MASISRRDDVLDESELDSNLRGQPPPPPPTHPQVFRILDLQNVADLPKHACGCNNLGQCGIRSCSYVSVYLCSILLQLAQMVVDGGAVAHLTLLISSNDTKLKRQVRTMSAPPRVYSFTGLDWNNWDTGLDWNTGLDYWTGILDWTTGLEYWTGLLVRTTGLEYWTI